MCQIRHLSLQWISSRLLALGLLLLLLNGCATVRVPEKVERVENVEKVTERNVFTTARGQDVIGRVWSVRLEKGDTLPDIARHFGLGINAITAANPGVDVWVPKAGELIMLPLSFILPEAPRRGIVINLATMRLFQFRGDSKSLVVSTYPVGIGMKERPTPTGQMRVQRKTTRPTWHVPASIADDHRKKGDPLPAEVPPGPENPLGEYALYLTRSSYLIHGTNKPASIGLNASNGCLRLYPENVKRLFDDTPVNTPVSIVNQPYLAGVRDGVVYLEAHTPLQGSVASEQEKIYAKLKSIEEKSGRAIDWKKVKEVAAEARGIPVPVSPTKEAAGKEAVQTVEVNHPEKLNGAPEIPELTLNGWYVLAAELRDETDARRMAAIINHQGPPIPARVLPRSKGYKVIAGPFENRSKAKDAARRLKIDLELDGIVIEPVTKT